MKIIDSFSKEELEMLKAINIIIEDREYTKTEIKLLEKSIYDNGYINMDISYANAEKYKQMYERVKYIDRVDLEKVKKYTKKEFEQDYYLCTIMMHKVLWNNPNKINNIRKNRNEKSLTKQEQQEYEKKFKESEKQLSKYMKYLEKKYGENLSIIEKYYSTK